MKRAIILSLILFAVAVVSAQNIYDDCTIYGTCPIEGDNITIFQNITNINQTGGGNGTADLSNVAFTNQSNTFTGNNTFNDNVTADFFFGSGANLIDVNFTELDPLAYNGSLILSNQEANLNVNSSVFWSGFNSTNSTQFENINGRLTIIFSWLISFLDGWLTDQTTDNLTEGSVNLYDNQSWNQTLGDDLYCEENGNCTLFDLNLTGDLFSLGDIRLNGTLFADQEFEGWHTILSFGEVQQKTVPSGGGTQFLEGPNRVSFTTTKGWPIGRNCQFTGIQVGWTGIVGIAGNDLGIRVKRNNNNIFFLDITNTAGVQYASSIQNVGLDSLSPNDFLTVRWENSGTQNIDIDEVIGGLEIVCYD